MTCTGNSRQVVDSHVITSWTFPPDIGQRHRPGHSVHAPRHASLINNHVTGVPRSPPGRPRSPQVSLGLPRSPQVSPGPPPWPPDPPQDGRFPSVRGISVAAIGAQSVTRPRSFGKRQGYGLHVLVYICVHIFTNIYCMWMCVCVCCYGYVPSYLFMYI